MVSMQVVISMKFLNVMEVTKAESAPSSFVVYAMNNDVNYYYYSIRFSSMPSACASSDATPRGRLSAQAPPQQQCAMSTRIHYYSMAFHPCCMQGRDHRIYSHQCRLE
jgi:hypothetical protein